MEFYLFDNTVNPDDSALNLERGFLFGDGFFTTGLIVQGDFLHLKLHLKRLADSAHKLGFKSFDLAKLKSRLEPLCERSTNACIRITISRRQSQRGYRIPSEEQVTVVIQLSPLPGIPDFDCELLFASTPISVNSFLAGLKHLNRLDNVLAASEVSEVYQESLLCDGETVICGSRTNLFIHQAGQWFTPTLDKAGIHGITRLRLITALRAANIPIEERNLDKKTVLNCEAAFVTNSLLGIWPVCKIENKALATDLVEQLQSQLNFVR
ncbi:aminodeoxychorismate lyase [Aliikangiella coralliicola]|uniref:aminodeoxychorismate lyase n=1 Tax=Aliikangiella coralliicola TaxID=2592383 RepID=UPI00143D8390|nr:aminodeoxychorismate lyase [Aliikangiella coralliicola]